MGIRITFFLLLLPLFSVAQTTDTKDVQWARQKLIIGTDAADYLNEITQTISAASTHVQSPTAKAVYDYLTGFLTTVNLSFSGTSSPVTLANSGGTDVTITAGTGVSLSATSSDITINNTQPLGIGTENYFPKWGTGGTVLTGTSNLFDNGTNIGVNSVSPFARMHVNSGDYGAYKNTTGTNGASLFLGDQNFNNSGFWDKSPGLTAVYSAAAGVAGNLGFYTYNGTRNLRMLLTHDGLFGVNQSTPSEALDVVGNLKISGAFKPGGNAGTSGYKLISQGASSAPIWELDTKFYQYDVVLPTTVSNAQGFAQITNPNFSANTEIWLTVADGGFAQSKRYFLPTTYNGTSGTWHKCLPVSSSGAYSGNDCEIDVNVNNAIAYFRVRRTAGTTAGTARITFLVAGYISGTTVSSFSTSYTSQVVSTNYAPTSLVQINGNTGIATDAPAKTLHVAGTARITGSDGTATTITGRDADGDISNVAIGSGLSLSGGTLSASAGSAWVYDGNTVGSLKTIGTNDNFDLPFETNGTIRGRFSTTGDFLINSTTTGNKLNVEGLGSSGVCARFNGGTFASGNTGVQIGGNATTTVTGLDVNMTVTGASNNLINRFRNGSTGASLHQIVVSSTSTADAMQQFQVEGGSGTTWIHGLDNSDADRYKIQPYSALGDGLLGIQVEKTGQVGISAAPAADLSLGFGLTKPLGLPSGVTADRAGSASIFSNTENGRIEDRATSSVYKTIHSITTPTLTPGTALGTGGTMAVTLVSGNEMAGRISIRTGATGLGTGTVMTFAYPTSMLGGAYPVWSAYGQNTPLQMNNFYISGIGSGSWTMAVLTTLSPNTTYEITYQIWQ